MERMDKNGTRHIYAPLNLRQVGDFIPYYEKFLYPKNF